MATCVAATGSDTWHWYRNFSLYPKWIAKRRPSRPTSGDLGNQCRSKERNGTCRKS